MKVQFRNTFVILLVFCLAQSLIAGSPSRPQARMSSSEIGLALQKLNVVGTALYLAAHPDDENTAMIAWFSKERLLRTGYLALTRGDGGQNLIGDEKGTGLGVIRTQELLEAREIDGGLQFFTRAVDFGYTKSPDETMEVWGHDEILADTVWVIRKFRPDVIVTRFPPTAEGGHGQHIASAIFAAEAFKAAADPTKFTDQLDKVEPWQVKRLFWDDYRTYFRRASDAEPPDMSKHLKVDIGAYNATLGLSYTEIAGQARTMHKSQGFGSSQRRGSFLNYLDLTDGAAAQDDPFDGVDLTWNRIKGGEKVAPIIERAIREYDPRTPHAIVPLLLEAYEAMNGIEDEHWREVKQSEVRELILCASGLWLEAIATDYAVTRGETAKIRLTAVSRSEVPVTLKSASSNWATWSDDPKTLTRNKPEPVDLEVTVPADAPLTQPYWLQRQSTSGRYEFDDLTLVSRPENLPALSFKFVVEIDGHDIEYDVPVLHRRVDPVRGELYRPFIVEPKLTVGLAQGVYIFPDRNARDVKVSVRAGSADTKATVGLDAPDGWTVDPSTIDVILPAKGSESILSFRLTPSAESAVTRVRAWAEMDGTRFTHSRTAIDHEHVPPQVYYLPAVARLMREDLSKVGSTIGYVEGSGDEIPEALRQVGYTVTMLDEDSLAGEDLSVFDSIVLGVRALNTREDAKRHYARLLDYARTGGTLVVQYNTLSRNLPEKLGPWPLKVSRDRITEEDSPMTIAREEAHPLLTSPNNIVSSDFDGWVQERGLYFPNEYDDKYQAMFVGNDTGEEPLYGSLLYSRYGEGVFVYTGLSFFRQLPAGVPGAYKIFLNLVSAN